MAEYLGVFEGLLTVGLGEVSDSLTYLWDPFPLTGLLSSFDVMVCAWSYYSIVHIVWFMSRETYFFLRGD